jgi:carboxypeptidase family protein
MMLITFALTLALQLPPSPPQTPGAPARDTSQAKTGTAVIRGRVLAADTQQPLRKALVRISASELREMRVTATDGDGKYEFTELPAGRYSINVNKGSYVSLSYGQLRPFESGRPLELRDGQRVEKVDFALPRGSVITGRVVDEFGEPIAGVMVSAMRSTFIQGRRQLRPFNSGSTNDLGEYRIYGLAPSQYYVSASYRPQLMMGASVNVSPEASAAYAPTYFPGTANPAEAQKVTLGIGQTAADVNVALLPVKSARISGTALNSAGQPMTGAMVMVMQRNGGMTFMSSAGSVKPDGTFSIPGVAPGEYTLQARGQTDPGSTEIETATGVVTVGSGDVADVQLAAVKPVTVSGRLTLDVAADASRAVLNSVRILATPLDPEEAMMGGGNATPKDDLTFTMKVRPGKFVLRVVNMLPGGTGQALKAIRLHGADVIDSGFEIKAGEDVSGIEVEMTAKRSELSGLVTDARGDAVRDYTIVVFARDRERWQPNTRYQMSGRPDQDGRYN